jgi:hypothetical protein
MPKLARITRRRWLEAVALLIAGAAGPPFLIPAAVARGAPGADGPAASDPSPAAMTAIDMGAALNPDQAWQESDTPPWKTAACVLPDRRPGVESFLPIDTVRTEPADSPGESSYTRLFKVSVFTGDEAYVMMRISLNGRNIGGFFLANAQKEPDDFRKISLGAVGRSLSFDYFDGREKRSVVQEIVYDFGPDIDPYRLEFNAGLYIRQGGGVAGAILPDNRLSREFQLRDGLYSPPDGTGPRDQSMTLAVWSGWKTSAAVNGGIAIIRPTAAG